MLRRSLRDDDVIAIRRSDRSVNRDTRTRRGNRSDRRRRLDGLRRAIEHGDVHAGRRVAEQITIRVGRAADSKRVLNGQGRSRGVNAIDLREDAGAVAPADDVATEGHVIDQTVHFLRHHLGPAALLVTRLLHHVALETDAPVDVLYADLEVLVARTTGLRQRAAGADRPD